MFQQSEFQSAADESTDRQVKQFQHEVQVETQDYQDDTGKWIQIKLDF